MGFDFGLLDRAEMMTESYRLEVIERDVMLQQNSMRILIDGFGAFNSAELRSGV
jgi:Mg2+/Co2+ transporter CorC